MDFELMVTPESAGWGFSSLRVFRLEPGAGGTFGTAEEEMIVLPLSGAIRVEVDGESLELAGRTSVFDAATDFAYLPRDAQVTVSSTR